MISLEELDRGATVADPLVHPYLVWDLWNLRVINLVAAVCHAGLTAVIAVFALTRDMDFTSIQLLRTASYWPPVAGREPAEQRCTDWAAVATTGKDVPSINLLTLTIVFCVWTTAAHLFYGLSPWYLRLIRQGQNPLRWIEYAVSASAMAVILAVLGNIRDYSGVGLIFATTAGQMAQGHFVEAAIKLNDLGTAVIATVTGWLLFAAAWGTILYNWYTVIGDARDTLDGCRALPGTFDDGRTNFYKSRGGMPDEIEHLMLAVVAFYSSFGLNSLWYLAKASAQGPAAAVASFPVFEFRYIVLSLSAKALLVIWCSSSIFLGELRWLQGCGVAEAGCSTQPITA